MPYEQFYGPTGGAATIVGNVAPIVYILGVGLFLMYVVGPIYNLLEAHGNKGKSDKQTSENE